MIPNVLIKNEIPNIYAAPAVEGLNSVKNHMPYDAIYQLVQFDPKTSVLLNRLSLILRHQFLGTSLASS